MPELQGPLWQFHGSPVEHLLMHDQSCSSVSLTALATTTHPGSKAQRFPHGLLSKQLPHQPQSHPSSTAAAWGRWADCHRPCQPQQVTIEYQPGSCPQAGKVGQGGGKGQGLVASAVTKTFRKVVKNEKVTQAASAPHSLCP